MTTSSRVIVALLQSSARTHTPTLGGEGGHPMRAWVLLLSGLSEQLCRHMVAEHP